MSTYTYADEAQMVISWTDDAGFQHSQLASSLDSSIVASAQPFVVDQKSIVQSQINTLELQQGLTRPVRLALLAAAVQLAAANGENEPQLYTSNKTYARVKDFDAKITQLANSVGLRNQ